MNENTPLSPQPAPEVVIVRSHRRGLLRNSAGHFWQLAGWKKALLVLAVVMGVIGIVGAIAGTVRSKPPEVHAAQERVERLHAAGPRSSLTTEQQQDLSEAELKVADGRHWFYDQTAPQLWRIGLGFFIAFVLGFAARQFVKTVAVLVAIVLVGAGVAIYFGQLDSGGVKQNLANGTGWFMDRVDSMKDALLAVATTSLSATVGFVLGFMRSKG